MRLPLLLHTLRPANVLTVLQALEGVMICPACQLRLARPKGGQSTLWVLTEGGLKLRNRLSLVCLLHANLP